MFDKKKVTIFLFMVIISGLLCMHPVYSQSDVVINSLDPRFGPPGTTVRITGEGFLPGHDTVMFVSIEHSGYFNMAAASFINENSITFTVPSFLNLSCHYDPYPCEAPNLITIPGEYEVYIGTMDTIESNTLLFTVPATAGDVNGDSVTDIVDALLVAQYYVGLDPAGIKYIDVSDVSCDEIIDIIDALLIAQYYVGIITEFTECEPELTPLPDPTSTPGPTPATPGDEFLEIIRNWAREQGIDLTGYNILQIQSKDADYILPGYVYFILYLIQYPVAYGPPDEQLGTQSILAIDNSSIHLLPDENYLESFYQQNQIPIVTEEDRIQAIKAWLSLSQELKNDGYYWFLISDADITIEHIVADYIEYRITGISRVISGGEGLIKATATIGVDGMLAYVEEKLELIPGSRPICQSTKLLDKDPVVRKMAEQDLLAMGYSAEQYLAAQRAKASPELKEAIDRIWERIIVQEEKRERMYKLLSGLSE